jgi:D-proline reductase (dithiol) PrdB
VGLIQRAIESDGIPTVGITLQKEVTRRVKPPRALHLRYPFGHPMGEAFAVRQQRAILLAALDALEGVTAPGTIVEPGWVWRRHRFD